MAGAAQRRPSSFWWRSVGEVPPVNDANRHPARRWPELLSRRILPGGLALTGVLMATQGGIWIQAGIGTVIAAGLVRLGGLLMQLGNASQTDRESEQEAREYFARTGRWPDEAPPAAGGDVPRRD